MKLGYRADIDLFTQLRKLTKMMAKLEKKHANTSPKATITLKRIVKKYDSADQKWVKVFKCISPLTSMTS